MAGLLEASVGDGLASAAVAERRQRFGANTITARRAASALHMLLHQFRSPVVYLLGTAAILAFYFGEIEEGSAILAVLAINAAIGFITELKAARSIEALRALGGRTARVRRDGHVHLVPADELVPGDVVLVEAGDAVSADLRLLEASRLAADESMLTGESVPREKTTQPVAPDAPLGDRVSMLFKGTSVTRGSAVGVVVATGLATQLGQVTQLALESDPGSSPLERKLARLSAQLVWATLVVAAAIAAVGLTGDQESFVIVEAAIALAVAAIPEGLPVVATLALARGMWRMARQNALIERLSAVETLGATTVVLTDKTGTLTENRMTVRRLWTSAGETEIGSGAPESPKAAQPAATGHTESLLRIAVLCNDAHLADDADAGTGDPMEIALLRAGQLAGLTQGALLQEYRLVRKHAFDPATRMMATVHEGAGAFLIAAKGAPEAVIAAATRILAGDGEADLDDTARAAWLGRADRLGEQGLRVIACARKTAQIPDDEAFTDLILVGLIGLEDPARADVPQAIEDCHQAGIRVVMVTGDHAVTAKSIGRAVGLADSEVVESKAIGGIIDAGPDHLRKIGIFARVSPADKLALVKAYQATGDIVAMTGDGVNDAPALHQADIGVAMGLRGTDVAREAAAMILLDDAFPTIIKAIQQGRIIFGNIRRFVAYLLSCNLSEIMVVGIAVASQLPLPLLPLQILYLNLVTDVFPAFALALGEGEAGILQRPPRDPKEPILGRTQWLVIVLHGVVLAAATFAALFVAGRLDLNARQTVTVTFLTLAFAQLWHTFNMRSARAGLLVNEVTRNGWLWTSLLLCTALLAVPPYVAPMADLLHLAPLTAAMWMIAFTCSLGPLVLTQTIMVVGRYLRCRR